MPRNRLRPVIEDDPPVVQESRIDYLRWLLKGSGAVEGYTWRDICESTSNPKWGRTNGVWFYGRIGCFLGRACIAVCAEDQFVLLKYNHVVEERLHNLGLSFKKFELDGSPQKGMTLFETDLIGFGIEPTDLVLNPEGE